MVMFYKSLSSTVYTSSISSDGLEESIASCNLKLWLFDSGKCIEKKKKPIQSCIFSHMIHPYLEMVSQTPSEKESTLG